MKPVSSEILTLRQVLDMLESEGYLEPESQQDITETLIDDAAKVEADTPWYVRLLISLSAWIAAWLLIGSLSLANLIDSGLNSMVIGLVFCAVAVGLRRGLPYSIFFSQAALAVSLAGQLLFTVGVGQETNQVWPAAFAAIILALILIPLYPDTLHRFLSTLIACGSAFIILFDLDLPEASHLLIILFALGTVWLWQNEARLTTISPLAQIYRPIGYALPMTLFAFLCFSLNDWLEIEWWWISGLGLGAILLGLEYQLCHTYGQASAANPYGLPRQAALWLYGGTILLLFPAYQTPGLFAALLILVLGFQRSNRLLMGLAIAFLALFLGGYYYNLTLTLLLKSYVLLGSGLILLIVRYFILTSDKDW